MIESGKMKMRANLVIGHVLHGRLHLQQAATYLHDIDVLALGPPYRSDRLYGLGQLGWFPWPSGHPSFPFLTGSDSSPDVKHFFSHQAQLASLS